MATFWDEQKLLGTVSTMVTTNRLVKIRKARGFSQEELGERVNETKAQVSRIERHRRGFRLEKMVEYAAALACHPAELFDEPWTIHKDEIIFIEVHRALDPAKQRALLQLARGLLIDDDAEDPPADDDAAASG